MNAESERLDRENLERLSTTDLLKHALDEVRLLAKAEILHARKEFKEEVASAKTSAILLGSGVFLAAIALSALVVALGLLIPVAPALGVAIAGGVFLIAGAALVYFGVQSITGNRMHHTKERLQNDLHLTRESLQ